MKLKFKLLITFSFSLLLAAAISVKLFFFQENKFPYGKPSSEIQITLKNDGATSTENTVYLISTKDLSGEAIFKNIQDDNEAQVIILSQLLGIKSAFTNSRAPYGGHITAIIDCKSQQFLKEEKTEFQSKSTNLILAIASERHIFGGCSLDQIKFAAGLWAAFDEKRKQVVTIKLFAPISNPNQIEESQQKILHVIKELVTVN